MVDAHHSFISSQMCPLAQKGEEPLLQSLFSAIGGNCQTSASGKSLRWTFWEHHDL